MDLVETIVELTDADEKGFDVLHMTLDRCQSDLCGVIGTCRVIVGGRGTVSHGSIKDSSEIMCRRNVFDPRIVQNVIFAGRLIAGQCGPRVGDDLS